MSACYTVSDMLSLTMALFQYPDAWVGVSTPGDKAPQRAAQGVQCGSCVSTDSVAIAKLKQALRPARTQIYLFPTYADLCAARHDIASPKCSSCGGPKK